jgi:hypothetical protein
VYKRDRRRSRRQESGLEDEWGYEQSNHWDRSGIDKGDIEQRICGHRCKGECGGVDSGVRGSGLGPGTGS